MLSQGPAVGAYPCNQQTNQQWILGANSISCVGIAGTCLTENPYPQPSPIQVVLDEFGNGEITLFGDEVINQCIGVCNAA